MAGVAFALCSKGLSTPRPCLREPQRLSRPLSHDSTQDEQGDSNSPEAKLGDTQHPTASQSSTQCSAPERTHAGGEGLTAAEKRIVELHEDACAVSAFVSSCFPQVAAIGATVFRLRAVVVFQSRNQACAQNNCCLLLMQKASELLT